MRKIHFLLFAVLVTGLSACEKEDFSPEPEPLQKEFKVIDFEAFTDSGDTTSYYTFTDCQTPALYLQGYAEEGLTDLRVVDYYISPVGREGDWVYLQTRDFNATEGVPTVIEYNSIDVGQHVVALYYIVDGKRNFIVNLYFEVEE